VTGYDNVTRQFVASWIDNFGTGIMYMTGKYDPATKALTFLSDMDDPTKPGTKIKVREVLRFVDPNKHVMEWYELRAGKDVKTMEIVYKRKKSAESGPECAWHHFGGHLRSHGRSARR
jgi:hypothetical protein